MNNIINNNNDIIERLKYFQKKKNVSSYKIGSELGHSKTYFYRVLSGEITLTTSILLEILEILDVSTTAFFCPIINDNDYKTYLAITRLNPNNKQMIIDLVNQLSSK